MKTIELGYGDKLVTDIHNLEEKWAGFCISDGVCPVGETIDTGCKEDYELDPEIRIITKNPKSLDAIIKSCIRAKLKLAV